jgi:hypothetical protein
MAMNLYRSNAQQEQLREMPNDPTFNIRGRNRWNTHASNKLRAIKAIAQVKRSNQIFLKSRTGVSSGLV